MVWEPTHFDFTLFEERDEAPAMQRCSFADEFYKWAQEELQRVQANPTHVNINQSIILITKRYREWRNSVPKSHKNRISETGHICIFHVWDEHLHALELAELVLTRPQLHSPQPEKKPRRKKEPPLPPPPPQPYNSILGDLDG